jgi:exo-beta-1,3-glucanase (GH17 family)
VNEIDTKAVREPARRLAGIAILLAVYAALTAGLYRALTARHGNAAPSVQLVAGSTPPRRNISLREGRFLLAGEPYFINAVGWDPARPGEVPWKRRFVAREVDEDFRRIHEAGFNTVRTWAPMREEELQLAVQNHLRVLQGIWTPPDADFRDGAVRRRVLDQVARTVETSRWSPAIIGYLVMNEPSAQAVAHSGLEATASWLREIVATVHALDPSAPVGYASWPGMEALDDDLLDFTAFNLYPHRPRAAMDELGIAAYVRLLRKTVARGRPFLVSEFGISASPRARDGRGGASEPQQAQQLVKLASTFAAAGAAGTSVFQWNDGWWKNHDREGDELTHDADDPEEWFGLLRFSGPGDRIGEARPALQALTRYNRAVVLEPSEESSRVRIFGAGAVELRANGAPVALHRNGYWLEGTLAVLRTEHRTTAAFVDPPLSVAPARQRVAPGATIAVRLQGEPGAVLRAAAYTEHHFDEQPVRVVLDRAGRGRAVFRAPDEETLLTVLAFDGRGTAAWAAAEVRRAP